MVRDRTEALFIDGDSFFASRFAQFVTLAARHGIATSSPNRAFPQAGGLMSYGTDFAEAFHQVGSYTGRNLKGAKPADLPVVQSGKLRPADLKTALRRQLFPQYSAIPID